MTDTIEPIEEVKIKLAKSSYNFIGEFNRGFLTFSPEDVDKLEILNLKKYKEILNQCRFFYRRDPIASTVLNKLVEIGITNLIFDKGKISDNEFRIYEGIKDKLQEYIESCALEYLISGFVIPERKYGVATKEMLNEIGVKKYSTMTLPVSLWLRNPDTVKIETSMVLDEPSYYVVLPDELIFFITHKGVYPSGNKDLELYRKLAEYYPEFIAQVEAGNKEVPLENNLIIRRKVLSDSPYPLPYLYNVLESLKHKRNLRRMDYSIASRVISAIQLFQLGDKDFPVTEGDEDQFDAIREQMAYRNSYGRDTERVFQLFANHTLKISWVFPDIQALMNERKYADINEDIFFALGFPKILTTGETTRTGSSNPEFASLSPVKTMESMQKKMLKIINGIIKEIADLNSFANYPEARFEKINLHTFQNFVEGMKNLYESGNISRTTYDRIFGFNWDEEMRFKEDEQQVMKDSKLPEFAPAPHSNQPNVPGTNQGNPQNNTQNNPQNG